jgi:hypothetical protein
VRELKQNRAMNIQEHKVVNDPNIAVIGREKLG